MPPLIVRTESVIAYSAAAGKRLQPICSTRPGFAAPHTLAAYNVALSQTV
jgi:hypothetical protein